MLRLLTITALLMTSAHAARAESQASVDVPFGDLNLSRAQDARVLAHRLQTAAEHVCLTANDADLATSRIGQQAMQECVDSAIRVAMERIESNLAGKVRANLVSAREIQPPH